jgi:hypothetical protein
MKYTYLFFILFLGIVITSCVKEESPKPETISQDQPLFQNSGATHCTSDIINAIDGMTYTDGATLLRNNNKIKMTFKVDDLEPGYAYTIWWVVWNNPEECTVPFACGDADFAIADDVEVELMYAAGHVVGNSGKGNFAGSLNEGDASGSINNLFGLPSYGGLHDARTAEVHLVLRSHGPAIPGQIDEQINTYEGGCVTNFPAFTEIPDEEGECGDYMFAIFPADCGL